MRAMRAPRRGDEGVAGIVTAVLVLAIFVGFLATVTLTWVPTWVEGAEASHSDRLRAGFSSWADSAEAHVARDLQNRTFIQTLPVGFQGLPVLGAGASTGRVSVAQAPTLTVSQGAVTVMTASGAFSAGTGHTRFPAQSFRYVLGALEHQQFDDTWVDLRALLTAQRVGGGKISLTVQAVSVEAPAQESSSGGQVQVLTTLLDSQSSSRSGGTVRVLADGVAGGAWRAAVDRVLGASGLSGESLSDCSTSTKHYCFDSDTNDADTVDLSFLNVADGWTAVSGSVRVEVRT